MRTHGLILMTLFLQACASSKEFRFTAAHDLKIRELNPQGNLETQIIRAGESFSIKQNILEASAEHRLPMLLIRSPDLATEQSEPEKWNLALKPVSEWRGSVTEDYISKEVDDLYLSLVHTLEKVKEGQDSSAQNIISQVIKRYPKLATAHYIKAQVDLVQGKTDSALRSLETAIGLKPGFSEAIGLKQTILKRKGSS